MRSPSVSEGSLSATASAVRLKTMMSRIIRQNAGRSVFDRCASIVARDLQPYSTAPSSIETAKVMSLFFTGTSSSAKRPARCG